MSVAYDLLPAAAPPAPPCRPRLYDAARGCALLPSPSPARPVAARPASVSVLHAPAPSSVAAPLRLTRRGLVVVALAVVALGAGLMWLAALSAPSPSAAPVDAAAVTVTVHPGDTLWGIASRVAPQRDPRAEVAQLRQLNHLSGTTLRPGQILRLH